MARAPGALSSPLFPEGGHGELRRAFHSRRVVWGPVQRAELPRSVVAACSLDLDRWGVANSRVTEVPAVQSVTTGESLDVLRGLLPGDQCLRPSHPFHTFYDYRPRRILLYLRDVANRQSISCDEVFASTTPRR